MYVQRRIWLRPVITAICVNTRKHCKPVMRLLVFTLTTNAYPHCVNWKKAYCNLNLTWLQAGLLTPVTLWNWEWPIVIWMDLQWTCFILLYWKRKLICHRSIPLFIRNMPVKWRQNTSLCCARIITSRQIVHTACWCPANQVFMLCRLYLMTRKEKLLKTISILLASRCWPYLYRIRILRL